MKEMAALYGTKAGLSKGSLEGFDDAVAGVIGSVVSSSGMFIRQSRFAKGSEPI